MLKWIELPISLKGLMAFDTYMGEINREGDPHGSGVRISKYGGLFEGHFMEGKRHGVGVLISPNGVVYEGEFSEDMRDGCGCLWEHSGPAYFGNSIFARSFDYAP